MFQVCISCAYNFFEPASYVNYLAKKNGFQKFFATHHDITIAGFYKHSLNFSNVLHVYIEGDGAPWPYPWLPPDDPTPISPIALEMAIADTHSNVLYLARPCQLTLSSHAKDCHLKLWTSARFSPEVVDATNNAISLFKDIHKVDKIIMFGYSGGGSVSALVAANRRDVIGLITASGTLDHKVWTKFHNASPLKESLNPINFAKQLSQIPQVHFIGEVDTITPPLIAKSYLNNLNKHHKAQLIFLKDFDHSCCWVKNWPKLLESVKFIN